jgi:hypothetical protein
LRGHEPLGMWWPGRSQRPSCLRMEDPPIFLVFLAWVPGPHGADGFDDQVLQHLLVYFGELLDVETALGSRMLAEPGSQCLRAAESGHVIQNSCGLARRKTDEGHIALATTVILIVVAAKTYDGWSPHLWFFAGRALHQFHECFGVCAPGRIRESLNKCRDT